MWSTFKSRHAGFRPMAYQLTEVQRYNLTRVLQRGAPMKTLFVTRETTAQFGRAGDLVKVGLFGANCEYVALP